MPKKKVKKEKEPFDSKFVTDLLNKTVSIKAGQLITDHTALDAIYMFSLSAYVPDSFVYEQDGKKMQRQDRLGFVLQSGATYYYINGQEDDLDRIANTTSSGWVFENPADGVSCIKPEQGGHLYLTHARYTSLYFMSDVSTVIDNNTEDNI